MSTIRIGDIKWLVMSPFTILLGVQAAIGEKRSFNFEEADLPGRYTKAGLFGAELGCHW